MKRRLLFILLFVAFVVGGSYGLDLYTKNFLLQNTFGGHLEHEQNLNFEEEVVDIVLVEEPEEPEVTSLSLLAVGDIMFHSPQVLAAKNHDNTYSFESVFKYVKPYIEEADISLGNLETVTAGREKGFTGFPRFNSPSEVIDALNYAGFDILSTANNHSLDKGKDGIISTIDTIEEKGLKNIGTYKENRSILIEERNGIILGFLSYTYGLNGLESLLSKDDLNNMINLIDEEKIESDIKNAKDLGAEITVVYIHWGHEYHREPSNYQIELGRKMIEWGANIILGSHPHVIQKSEIIKQDGKDNFIIYSMGNFLSNQRYETMGDSYTEDGVMVNIVLEKNHSDSNVFIKDITYIPTWVYRFSENNKLNYYILPLNDLSNIDLVLSDATINRMKKSYDDTLNTLNTLEVYEYSEIENYN